MSAHENARPRALALPHNAFSRHMAVAATTLAALTLGLLLAGNVPAPAHEMKVGDISVSDAWSKETPPNAPVAGGYLTITNEGDQPDRLVSVSSPIADHGEIHEMSVDDKGVMTMRPVADGLEIPAHGTVELKPGGYHLMFMELKERPKEGETFDATLGFEKAGSLRVHFEVTGMGGKAPMKMD